MPPGNRASIIAPVVNGPDSNQSSPNAAAPPPIKSGIMITQGVFDTSVALSGLYLWMLFGYLATMMNCDLQRFIKTNVLFRHFIAVASFFFLFTVIDSDNKAPIHIIWMKTLFVYCLYILAIKSKWYFAVPVIGLLLIDQTIKIHVKYINNNAENDDSKDAAKETENYNSIRSNINTFIIFIIGAGFIHYIFRKYRQFGSKFSLYKLITSESCSMKERL